MTTTVILTNYGNDKILQAIAEESTVTVSAIVYGDGNGSEYVPLATQTELRNQLGSISLLEKVFDPVDGFIYFKGTIEASSADFTLRELGLLDDTNKLLAIATIPSTSKPSTSEGIEVSLPLAIGFKTSTGSVLIVEHDASDVASKQWTLDNFQLLSEKGQNGGYAPLNNDGVVPAENSLIKYDTIGNTTYESDVAKTVVLQNENSIPMMPLSDVRNTRTDLKLNYWVGDVSQAPPIGSRDPETVYHTTGDSDDLSFTLLDALYPIGSLYIASSSLSTCPLALLGVGRWTLVSVTRLITNISTESSIPVTGSIAGNGKTLGLTNGSINFGPGLSTASDHGLMGSTYLYDVNVGSGFTTWAGGENKGVGVTTDTTKSGLALYNATANTASLVSSTVLPVTIWERIA